MANSKNFFQKTIDTGTGFLVLGTIAVVGLGGLTYLKMNTQQDVLGEATHSATLTPHQMILNCGQCVAQAQFNAGKNLGVGLCFHISGKDSYAKCQYGSSVSSLRSNGNTCVVCKAPITPTPKITHTPESTLGHHLTPFPTKPPRPSSTENH